MELSESERLELQTMLSGGEQAVQRLKRAQILLASDLGQREEAVARTWGLGYPRCIERGGVLWKAALRAH